MDWHALFGWKASAADFNRDAGIVTVRESKGSKPRHVVLTGEGQQLFAALTAGKLAGDPIFTRPDGGEWGKSHPDRWSRRANGPRSSRQSRFMFCATRTA